MPWRSLAQFGTCVPLFWHGFCFKRTGAVFTVGNSEFRFVWRIGEVAKEAGVGVAVTPRDTT